MRGELKHKPKKLFKLDSFKEEGIFKNSKPDIIDIWSEQRHIRNLENINKKKKTEGKNYKKLVFYKLKKFASLAATYFTKSRKKLVLATLIVLSFVALKGLNNKKPNTETLGASNTALDQSAGLPVVNNLSFDILYSPNFNNSSRPQIVNNSPPGNPPAYVYVDILADQTIQITQQELPDNLKKNQDTELKKIAESFNAPNIIQIDETIVYHGLSDKLKVQSLVFIKDNLLVLIKSPQQLSDDQWAGYISTLHK
jgi:hypothetical protein